MRIYLDYNATAPLHPDARARIQDAWDAGWANPAAPHAAGHAARRALEDARAEVADLLDAAPSELIFTSGATEALAAALWGMTAAARRPDHRPVIAISAAEHPAALRALDQLVACGLADARVIPVDADGLSPRDALQSALRGADGLCLMAANNETGALADLDAVGAEVAAAGVPWLCDTTQLAGRLPLRWSDHPAITALTLSAHKLGGPAGIGALLLRRGHRWAPLLPGSQEAGRRGGTANVPGAAGFAAAASAARRRLAAGEPERLRRLRDQLHLGIVDLFASKNISGQVRLNGPPDQRLPNTLHLTLSARGDLLDAEDLLLDLSARGVAVATGAACASLARQPSHVLLAMGRSPAEAHASLRLSLGDASDDDACQAALKALADVLE